MTDAIEPRRSNVDPLQVLASLPNDHVVRRAGTPDAPGLVHVLDRRSRVAMMAALACDRPLLVRGEPGIGKTQLAEAAAVVLGRRLLPEVVDSRSEARDLLYRFDAVRRLAEAQTMGTIIAAAAKEGKTNDASSDLLSTLQEKNFLSPGVFWTAFGYEDPSKPEAEPESPGGYVVLIDEIDKAESDLPNGLLGVLGSREFSVPGYDKKIRRDEHLPAPLVVITTNEERSLPNPFVRRCVVLDLWMPDDPEFKADRPISLEELLIERGRQHFPGLDENGILQKAAEQVAKDRAEARTHGRKPLPGQAEYLDLLRAVDALKISHAAAKTKFDPLAALDSLAAFIVSKHGRPE
ncbi:MAG: MoxR family ATPase [Isosphaeraceae bacterium]|nr:MoxR family ATPase [Isosphaeraceae bacterium]